MVTIKAVAYYRMSSDKQEASIADQRTAVEAFAGANGYKIVREYRDEGISGWKSEQRKGFQKLIEDANSGDFQADTRCGRETLRSARNEGVGRLIDFHFDRQRVNAQ